MRFISCVLFHILKGIDPFYGTGIANINPNLDFLKRNGYFCTAFRKMEGKVENNYNN